MKIILNFKYSYACSACGLCYSAKGRHGWTYKQLILHLYILSCIVKSNWCFLSLQKNYHSDTFIRSFGLSYFCSSSYLVSYSWSCPYFNSTAIKWTHNDDVSFTFDFVYTIHKKKKKSFWMYWRLCSIILFRL